MERTAKYQLPYAIFVLENISSVDAFEHDTFIYFDHDVDNDWTYVTRLIHGVIRRVNDTRRLDPPTGKFVIDVRDQEWRERYYAIIDEIITGMIVDDDERQRVIDQFVFVRIEV